MRMGEIKYSAAGGKYLGTPQATTTTTDGAARICMVKEKA